MARVRPTEEFSDIGKKDKKKNANMMCLKVRLHADGGVPGWRIVGEIKR